MKDWPIELRVLIVCATLAAIVISLSQGVVIFAVAAALFLLIIGLVS